jgi:uncharacterized membrane protein
VTTTNKRPIPRTAIWVSLGLSLAGLAVATYLTIEHFNTALTLACPDTGRINCQRVTTSHYSHLAGIPVAVLGVVYFAVATALMTPRAWRSTSATLRWTRIGWVSLGLLTVVYLVWAEFFGVNAICLWCTSVHVITFLLFVLVVFTEAWTLPDPELEAPAALD